MASSAGQFVRGFFRYLNGVGVDATILHGWESNFENKLSDVDFAVRHRDFGTLVAHVSQYCMQVGWRLCQVLRHECTAAYCVCSNRANPRIAVALDPCSDYCRRGKKVLDAGDLMANYVELPWGGKRLTDEMELRYRFVKAALKNKPAHEFFAEFQNYSGAAKADLERWLEISMGITHSSWDVIGLVETWRLIDSCLNKADVDDRLSTLKRVSGRILRPTGLLVSNLERSVEKDVVDVFGHLYFRRTVRVDVPRCMVLKPLISSTLVCCKKAGRMMSRILGPDLLIEARDGETSSEIIDRILELLESRCVKREGLKA